MSGNTLDDILDSIKKTWGAVGFTLSPLTIGITLFVSFLPFIVLYLTAITQKEKPPAPPEGCRRLGIQGTSNISDQYSKKYSQGGESSKSNPWKVKALFIYPVKSCKGIELEKTEVNQIGLKYDRQFTLAQYVTGLPTLQGKVESDWHVMTLRTFPRLAKVETEMWVPDPNAAEYTPDGEWVKSEGCIVIRFPFTEDLEFSLEGFKTYARILAAKLAGKPEPMVEFRIPYNPPKERIKKMKYRIEKVKIWKDMPEALDISNEIPEEVMAKLKYTLGVANPMSLLRIDTEKYRPVFKNAPKKKDVGFQTIIGMQDSYPMHILNLASVHDIASNLPSGKPKVLSALRYRPNLLVTGPPAFSEDNWTKASIGKGKYHISCRTTRCKLPNVNPDTAIADRNEPGATMRKYRVIDQGSNSPCLGMQVTPLEEGTIEVGDEVEVLETGEHFFLKV